jgi:hypothetical protein
MARSRCKSTRWLYAFCRAKTTALSSRKLAVSSLYFAQGPLQLARQGVALGDQGGALVGAPPHDSQLGFRVEAINRATRP